MMLCMSPSIMLLASLFAFQQGPSLKVGSPAPKIEVEAWAQGSPQQITNNKIYVLEFWATWCGPCIEAMPHLSTLSEKYRGKVEFIGVNIADRQQPGEREAKSKAHLDRVNAWVKANSQKMRYNVALDDAGEFMNKNWMLAAGRNGIPCTFVVQNGKIAFIGHPNELEKPLAEIVAGKFDLKAAAAKYDADLSLGARAAELRTLASKGDLEVTEIAFQEFKKVDPNKGIGQIVPLSHALAGANPSAGVEFLSRRSKDTFDDPTFLVMMAYAISSKVIKNEKALKSLVEFSSQFVGKVPDTSAGVSYSYHALLLLMKGDQKSAIEWAKKAEIKAEIFEPIKNRENIKNFAKSARQQAEAGKYSG